MKKRKLTKLETESLLKVLKERFENNAARHANIQWIDVAKKLETNPDKLVSLFLMEETFGEPDIVGVNNGEFIIMDTSKESPTGRYNLCYDREALDSRKKFKPENSAVDLANEIGIEILDEEQYRYLQSLVEVDLKTSSWIKTPVKIRKLGGALFADKRFDTIFVYHNGAESYYSGRGFRGILKV